MFPATEGFWQTLEKKFIAIGKMDDKHLTNSIKTVRRNLKREFYSRRRRRVTLEQAEAKLRELEDEANRRGLPSGS